MGTADDAAPDADITLCDMPVITKTPTTTNREQGSWSKAGTIIRRKMEDARKQNKRERTKNENSQKASK